ncbi:rab-GTPase-TBC domain-domain-containing protein [Lobosporangium transversale]|uniref:Rab-GTPase-TBC domain-domain-containing protein n=1 Tax=Lobosporangium transversale TaxID=64571 RepID=A0A1Y2G597_9FUNG|nr:rab-GTPase-TBC domain-domain-containing protein [Lobosporangium transversale]ORY94330.1 rab-GTPase-TBC domain-domain-containing protein [Lobosporangium transversale]|eukprot:XP_021875272.1 rab-GTPase-TBC domain-domain-containing protein [Lobosporangium transversale]
MSERRASFGHRASMSLNSAGDFLFNSLVENVQKGTSATQKSLRQLPSLNRSVSSSLGSTFSLSSIATKIPTSNALEKMIHSVRQEEQNVSMEDATHRIVLQCSHENYVVALALDESAIRADWDCIHKTVFPKITDLELDAASNRRDENESDRKWIYELDRLSEALSLDHDQDKAIMSAELDRIFGFVNEELLCFYRSSYIREDGVLLTGHIALTKNYVCWHNSPITDKTLDASAVMFNFNYDPSSITSTKTAYKDVIAIENEHQGQKGYAVVITRAYKSIFVPTFHQREILDMLTHFCNAYMRLLVSSIGDGEPGHNSQKQQPSMVESQSVSSQAKEIPTIAFSINSTSDLKTFQKEARFRSLFRLPPSETPLEEFIVSFETRLTADAQEGTVYMSQNFICYMSGSLTPGISTSDASSAEIPTPSLMVVIPLSEILEIKREQSFSSSNKMGGTGGGLFHSASNQQTLASLMSLVGLPQMGVMIILRSRFALWFTRAHGSNQELYDAFSKALRATGHSTALLKTLETQTSQSILRRNPSTTSSIWSSSQSEDHTLVDECGNTDCDGTAPLQVGLQHLLAMELEGSDGNLQYPMTQATFNKKDQQRELDIESAWVDYFAFYGRDMCMVKTRKLQRLILDGVSETFRPQLWMVLSGASYFRSGDDSYRLNLQACTEKVSSVLGEIEKDVMRSMPGHPAFQSATGLGALRRVLFSYSWRNPSIGYAQSMNIIASVFLLHLKEEDAYWLLATLCEQLLPDYYSKTLFGVQVDQKVFSHLMGISLPALAGHFYAIDFDQATITLPWFLCLFQSAFPVPVATRVLDCFFYEGPLFLFMLGLAILKSCQSLLLHCKNDEEVVMTIQSFFRSFKDPEIPELYRDRLVDSDEDADTDADSADRQQSQRQGHYQAKKGEKTLLLHPNRKKESTVLQTMMGDKETCSLNGMRRMDQLLEMAYADFSFITQNDVQMLRDRFRMTVASSMNQNNTKF